MLIGISFIAGLLLYFMFRVVLTAFYVVRPDQRAVITTFGRAERLPSDLVEWRGRDSERDHERTRERASAHLDKLREMFGTDS